jgi:type IV pilus assembly protein PilA
LRNDRQGVPGFTIIEMMVVVGVVAVLALMLVPAYTDRLVREQVNEALPLAEVAKKPVADAWAAVQAFPADNAAASLPPREKIVSDLVSGVAVESGSIHVTFGNRANNLLKGKVLTLRPAVVEDAPVVPVTWLCGFAAVPDKMAAKTPNRTSVPKGYLPVKCR